jgi:DNA helicase HerA-like ATPase
MDALDEQSNDAVTIFAETDFREARQRFGIKRRDRRHHMYLVGKTGMGKSTLLRTLVVSDLRAGNGLALVDPHGDLADDVVRHVPESRRDDLIVLDPSTPAGRVAFNPLAVADATRRHLAAAGLVTAFRKIWADSWGPRVEYLLYNTLRALLDFPGASLLEVPRFLASEAYRMTVLRYATDPRVRDFWRTEFSAYPPGFRAEALSPLQNKVGQYLASPVLREILGQSARNLDLRRVMDEGKILVANLSKGKLGEATSSLLGALVIAGLELAALGRAEVRESQRRDFYLYVDEFQTFATSSLAGILQEARKYRLNLILAHQYLGQLEDQVREAIFGNVGTIVAFRVGAEDAQYLAREFYPIFSEEDFLNLPPHRVYLRLTIDGVMSRPFSARTLAVDVPSSAGVAA